jgi:hypothetical protein
VFGDSFSHVASPCFTLVNADKSGNRDATATGNIDGHDLGAVDLATIFTAHTLDVLIDHSHSRPLCLSEF